MDFEGTVRGGRIELDSPLPMADGTRIRVGIAPIEEPPRGSPEAILRLAGTLTNEEADEILNVAQQVRRIDASLWNSDA